MNTIYLFSACALVVGIIIGTLAGFRVGKKEGKKAIQADLKSFFKHRRGLFRPKGWTSHDEPLHIDVEVKELERTTSGKVKVEILKITLIGKPEMNTEGYHKRIRDSLTEWLPEKEIDWLEDNTTRREKIEGLLK